MSDDQSRGFEKYDSMTTEELEEILRLDVDAPEDQESDEDLIFYIMGVLADRRRNENAGYEAQKALESFRTHYMPADEEIQTVPDCPRKKVIPWLRRLTTVAATLAIVIGLAVSANALSLRELWDVFAKWTRETFSFVTGADTEISEPNSKFQDELLPLQELLANSMQDPNIVPTWIPDGFELDKVEMTESPIEEIYSAIYIGDEKELVIRIRHYLEADPEKIEISDDLLETYESEGVQHYIFYNMDQLQTLWIVDSYQCTISGDVSLDEIKLMIDSVGKG